MQSHEIVRLIAERIAHAPADAHNTPDHINDADNIKSAVDDIAVDVERGFERRLLAAQRVFHVLALGYIDNNAEMTLQLAGLVQHLRRAEMTPKQAAVLAPHGNFARA